MVFDVYNQTTDPYVSKTVSARNDQDTASVVCITGDITHALNTANNGKGSSEDGTGRGVPTVAVPILEAGARTGKSTTDPRAGIGIGADGDPMFTLQAGKQHAVAAQTVALRGRDGGATAELGGEVATSLRASSGGGGDKPHVLAFHHNAQASQLPTESRDTSVSDSLTCSPQAAAAVGMAVRRLTPEECETLQAFPRGHTAVPYRGKIAADGPRYKAIGNSMCCNVMAWIGRRIAAHIA